MGARSPLGPIGWLQCETKCPPVPRQSVGQAPGLVRSPYGPQTSCPCRSALTIDSRGTPGSCLRGAASGELPPQRRPPRPPLGLARITWPPEASPAPRGRLGHRTGTWAARRPTCCAREVLPPSNQHSITTPLEFRRVRLASELILADNEPASIRFNRKLLPKFEKLVRSAIGDRPAPAEVH